MGIIVEWYRQGKFLIRPPELSLQSYQQSDLVVKQEELAKEMINWPSEVFLFILRRVLQDSIKFYDMGPPVLLPIRSKLCFGFLSPLKSITFGRVWIYESSLTIIPPRTASGRILLNMNELSRIVSSYGCQIFGLYYHRFSTSLLYWLLQGFSSFFNQRTL
jgi:hypothetical protein